MLIIRAFGRRHPVLTYSALTFAISWGSVILVVGEPGRLPGTAEQIERLMLFAMLALFAGPSVAGVVMTSPVHGRAGFHHLLTGMTRWQGRPRWYAVAQWAVVGAVQRIVCRMER